MVRRSLPAALVMLAAVLLSTGADAASPRGTPATRHKTLARPALAGPEVLAKLGVWLRRLPGSYRINSGAYERMVDCTGVGEGPGVQCMIGPPPIAPDPHPTAVLYGMAADVPGIRYLQVNGQSTTEAAEGKLSGDTVTFPKVSCLRFVNQRQRVSIMTCDKMMRIYAPEHGKYFMVSYYWEMMIVVPTPLGGRRPSGQIATELVQIDQHTYYVRARNAEADD